MGARVAYLVRRHAGKALVAAAVVGAVVVLVRAVVGDVDWKGALYLFVLWLVVAVSHALGFDLFESDRESSR